MSSPEFSETKIVQYLIEHPEFFERHAELLSNIKLIDRHGQNAISLQERQAFLLREKIKQQEQRMLDMIRFGNENHTTSNRLHKWVLMMLQCRDLSQLPALCCSSLQENFFIPQVGIRLWNTQNEYANEVFAQSVSASFMTTLGQIKVPYVGINHSPESAKWLNHPEHVSSIALLPLFPTDKSQTQKNFGMIIFASPDSQRFTTHMGTDFLSKIAEIASAALWPLINSAKDNNEDQVQDCPVVLIDNDD